jgi:hypothetical protein
MRVSTGEEDQRRSYAVGGTRLTSSPRRAIILLVGGVLERSAKNLGAAAVRRPPAFQRGAGCPLEGA